MTAGTAVLVPLVPRSARGRRGALLVGLALAAALLAGAELPRDARLLAALTLLALLPGYLIVEATCGEGPPHGLERGLLGVACGYTLAILLMLALHALARPIEQVQLLGAGLALNGVLVVAACARGGLQRPWSRPGWPLLVTLAVAGVLRFANLGYSELQGDEALVLLRAMAVLQGVPDALIAHRKPPGEVLLSAALVGSVGSIGELSARLPFALAGLVGVALVHQLGVVCFGAPAAFAAGLLLAVNGYFVAFGRVLQYESLALLLQSAAILCLYRFAVGPARHPAYALLGALLLASAALTAFSAVFLAPVTLYALWASRRRLPRASWRVLALWLWPLALLLPLGLVVLVRASQQPDAMTLPAAGRYAGFRLGDDRPYFNLAPFLLSVNHYLSSPYAFLVLGAGLLVLAEPLVESLRRPVRRSDGAPRGAAGLALPWPSAPIRHLGLALLLTGAIGLLLGRARRPLGWKLGLVWLAGPLLTHLFLVRDPGTHWRELFPGLVLLVGAAVAADFQRLTERWLRRAALAAGMLFLGATAHYQYVSWIQPWPEYQLLYPLYRHPLDWTSKETRSAGGTFGATRRHGWKTVAELMDQGVLPTAYLTNERLSEAAFYLGRPPVCLDEAELFIRAPITPEDRLANEQGLAPPGFNLAGWVEIDGRRGLVLLRRGPQPAEPQIYQLTTFETDFDQQAIDRWEPIGRLYRPSITDPPACRRDR